MNVNVYEMIKDDKFFIGSYPNNFAVGRWFTVEELASKDWYEIEEEYLEKYNPDEYEELELGVFDVDNESGLWRGEYDVSELIDKLVEIFTTEYYDVDLEIFEFTQDFFDEMGFSAYEVAQMVFFGNIKSWGDEYIGFTGAGNFESYTQSEYEAEALERVKDLGLF
ncbi:hypothetical protein [Pseudolactococcus insecticola]|uniref:Antirestriction protein ArdA n=1 Tax=Pseudolactococcus insecticola TaxID=2709158 RepID=A0A6A0B7R9_9LACT|nr:hypothetical protein [Lactococcus insecticola]GFH40825.1 hypothetical protein Hs20B_12230 [Lactococcus insecticola]